MDFTFERPKLFSTSLSIGGLDRLLQIINSGCSSTLNWTDVFTNSPVLQSIQQQQGGTSSNSQNNNTSNNNQKTGLEKVHKDQDGEILENFSSKGEVIGHRNTSINQPWVPLKETWSHLKRLGLSS